MDQSDWNFQIKEELLRLREAGEGLRGDNLSMKEELLHLREDMTLLRGRTSVIDRGDWHFADGFDPSAAKRRKWNLSHSGKGNRIFREPIDFKKSFTCTPEVVVSLRGIDSSTHANTRIETAAVDVTTAGFNLLVRTWQETEIYGVWFTWVAIGNVNG